jgi:hypothetical protein
MPARIIPSSFPIGTPFGRLTTTTLPYHKRRGQRLDWYVSCRCSCGNTRDYRLWDVRNGSTRSCGCLVSDISRDLCLEPRKPAPGGDARLKRIWYLMKQRCCDPKQGSYHRYGGRGIKICEPWLNSFAVFREWAVNHPAYREGLTIERMDNDGDYTPENCTWIPLRDQASNRSDTRYFEYQGEKKTLPQWSKDPRCIAPSLVSLCHRMDRGWDFEAALTSSPQRFGFRIAKVTEDQIREIRTKYAAGIRQCDLAREYKLSRNNVSNIVNRKTWACVEP